MNSNIIPAKILEELLKKNPFTFKKNYKSNVGFFNLFQLSEESRSLLSFQNIQNKKYSNKAVFFFQNNNKKFFLNICTML